ncbi:MAG: zinc transporter ZupT [Defluviitaleaceae bacterium]|nr:zinc transporter ZupT [Defluviitaleaceae bacterium]MCL2238486.1 zinc transporter ZupT [Defluviitaleaceae bacterium]
MSDITFAFTLTLLAGLATGVGGCVALFTRMENKKALSVCLSFAAGVMIYISFAEILLKGFEGLEAAYGEGMGYLIATVAFFGGVAFMAVLEKIIPQKGKDLKRTGTLSAIAIAIHNFPEGFITFMAAMYDPALGVAIAIAVAIHNIPEGIAMAAPLYYATGSKAKAIAISTLSGLTEPLGGLVAWLALRHIFGDVGAVFGLTFAAVGGIMVFVAVYQLLPTAGKYDSHASVMRWLFAGMAVMAASLVAMEFV